MSEPLMIVGAGAITPVGLSAAQTCASIRASLANFTETGFFHLDMEPVIGAQVPFRPKAVEDRPLSRLAALAARALGECIDSARIDLARCALLLGMREPSRRGHGFDWPPEALLKAVEEQLQCRFHAESRTLPDGNAATFRGVTLARELLASGRVQSCILGGVDSFLNDPDLTRLKAAYRIKRSGMAHGLIPGEGACFVAATTQGHLGERRLQGEILGVGLAEEAPDRTVTSEGYPTGKALRNALDAAIRDAGLLESEIDFRISDLNGEDYGSINSLIASSRFYRTRRERLISWYPASCVGETGAAAGAIAIISALFGWLKGYAPGATVMCEASSDGGLRGACLLAGPTPSAAESRPIGWRTSK
jgi:3-oxoacyl-[acyl-carrier-protein] synthase I